MLAEPVRARVSAPAAAHVFLLLGVHSDVASEQRRRPEVLVAVLADGQRSVPLPLSRVHHDVILKTQSNYLTLDFKMAA